jgi:transposase
VHRRHHRPSRPLCRRGRKKGDPEEPADHALGRSRGGFSTKIHLLCDANGHPLHFHLTAGQEHESTVLDTLLEGVDVCDSEGVPIVKPVSLAGDKGYRADWIDAYLHDHGIRPIIPSKSNECPETREARAADWDESAYRQRNIIERLVGWLKESRRIFSRFEKTAKNYAGMMTLAFIQRYLRLLDV